MFCVARRPVVPALLLAMAVAAAPAMAELSLGGIAPAEVEETVEERIEEVVEEEVAEQVQEEVAEQVQEEVETAIEDQLELSLGGIVQEQVEETVEERVSEVVEEVIEDSVEDVIDDSVQEVVEESVEVAVEEQVEDEIAETIEEAVEESVAESVEESVEESTEQLIEEAVEETVASSVEESVEESVAEQVEDVVEASVQVAVAQSVEDSVADGVEERLENEIDDILDDLESDLEMDERRILREQWLVMAEPEVFEELAEEGYLFDTVTDLPSLGMRLAEVAGPSSFDITEVRRGVLDVVGKDRAEVDLNHIYTAGTQVASTAEGIAPRSAIQMMSSSAEATSPRIGMIDSQVDTSHPALSNSQIESRTFARDGADLPTFHGTAVASILAANSVEYQGLAPEAQLYAAAVFESDPERGEIASTVSLLRALDWLISTQVDVVNISLAGPPNRLLETALKRAADQDVLVLAAAGNGGPVAQPMYPAAYDSVVAVTAVDSGNQVFRLANRGEYLDLAAPGVDLLHAQAGGGYVASSGTSFAVPFAAAAAASLRQEQSANEVLATLYGAAEDLGPPGRDEIYGYGLLRIAVN